MIDGELKSRQTASDPIHPIRLAAQIQKYVSDDALYVVDGGDTSYFGLVGFMSKHKAGVIGSSSGLLGCLGTGIPFAMAGQAGATEYEGPAAQRRRIFRLQCHGV